MLRQERTLADEETVGGMEKKKEALGEPQDVPAGNAWKLQMCLFGPLRREALKPVLPVIYI